MPNLDSVESRGDQGLQSLASSKIAGVCPDRQRTSLVRDRDRILDRKLVLRHERAAVAAEVSHERIAEIVNHAARDEGTSDVGTADGPAVCLSENFVEGDWYSERVQLVYDLLGAGEALGAQIQQALLESLQVRQVKREHVNFVIILEGAELDARNHADAEPVTRRTRRRNSADRVVVGQRNGLEAAARRSFDYLLWWENAVGGGGVGMQVDERRPARLGAHFV